MGVPYAEVIGDPVAHSKSPVIHRFWLKTLGIEADYRAIRVTVAELPAYLASRRADPDWCGCNVTMPLKRAIQPLLDEQLGAAATIGAINTVTRSAEPVPRLVGHNTDVVGFLEPLCGWPPPDKVTSIADVIGTGGAASAVYWGLKRLGFVVFTVARTRERGAEFQRRFGEEDPDFVQLLARYADPPAQLRVRNDQDAVANLLVNASPLGMVGQPALPFNLDNIGPGTVVYDLVTQPAETDLIRRARERGHRVISGLEMLIGQAAEAFGLLFGIEPLRDRDDELRQRLTS